MLRASEAEQLRSAGFPCGAYYLMGYAVECAIKACIAKQIKKHDFPDRKLVSDSYVHDLEKLLAASGLKERFRRAMESNTALELNWNIVKDWSTAARYRTNISKRMASDFLDACNDKRFGVLSWLKKRW